MGGLRVKCVFAGLGYYEKARKSNAWAFYLGDLEKGSLHKVLKNNLLFFLKIRVLVDFEIAFL